MDTFEKAVYTVVHFLSQRDVPVLSFQSVKDYFGGENADAVIVFGNDLPQVAEAGCEVWKKGIGRWLAFCGGTGHSTEILKRRFRQGHKYWQCRICDSEAEMFAEIAEKLYGIPGDRMLLDTTSGNCGENAEHAGELLRAHGIIGGRLILLQDPLMQRRSVMSLKRFVPDASILSYAPFLPEIHAFSEPTHEQEKTWMRERFMELLLGEIRRLRDDENGYGPNGVGYIGHIDIPEEVERAWQFLYHSEKNCRRRC